MRIPCPGTLVWSATGPRSQRLRQPARAGTLPKSPIAFGPAARRDVARSGRRSNTQSVAYPGGCSVVLRQARESYGNWRMSEENPKPNKNANPRDDFDLRKGLWVNYGMILVIVGVTGWFLTAIVRMKIAVHAQVFIYTSQDQVYAEPILKEFQRQTSINARAAYDSEAVKTVGLVNRLLAEKDHPLGDIFWNNEELRTRQLAAKGVLEKWVAVGHRSRRIAINTNKLSLAAAPHSLVELTNVTWRGKVALAYPLFGTTATHFLALRQAWGDERWQTWCRALAANRPFLVDGNSVAAKLVAKGGPWVGLTDSDDIAAEQREIGRAS